MKTKASKQSKQTKPSVRLRDIKPKKDAKGGIIAVMPAMLKIRSSGFSGGVNVAAGDVNGD